METPLYLFYKQKTLRVPVAALSLLPDLATILHASQHGYITVPDHRVSVAAVDALLRTATSLALHPPDRAFTSLQFHQNDRRVDGLLSANTARLLAEIAETPRERRALYNATALFGATKTVVSLVLGAYLIDKDLRDAAPHVRAEALGYANQSLIQQQQSRALTMGTVRVPLSQLTQVVVDVDEARAQPAPYQDILATIHKLKLALATTPHATRPSARYGRGKKKRKKKRT